MLTTYHSFLPQGPGGDKAGKKNHPEIIWRNKAQSMTTVLSPEEHYKDPTAGVMTSTPVNTHIYKIKNVIKEASKIE